VNEANQPAAILVIDDERDIRDGCERFLSRMGCQVAKAPDGQAGLDYLARHPVAIVLLDLKMPGLDGMEVLRRIRHNWPEVLVIVITGYATVETAIEAMKQGAYDFIPKPFQPDQLRLTVGRALERHRLAVEAARAEAERRRTLADLDAEKSRTRTIIQAMPFGVAVTTAEGNLALMNPAFRRMLGLPQDAEPGKHISHYVDDPGLVELATRVSRGGERAGEGEDTHQFTTPAGRHLLAQATGIPGEEGECLGAVLVFVDITAFKLLDQLKSDFVAKVSHELRSPLSTIYLQLSLLASDQDLAADQESRHLLERARSKTEALISFVRDLLDISRIESGQALGEPRPVEVAKLLRQVVEALRPQAEAREQSLELELPPEGLPALVADPTALESVFTNLVSNACKYTPEGGWIRVAARVEDGRLVVVVSDNGFGIPPEKHQAVFEKFYRIKDANTRYIPGTGLGLPIVKSILEQMGGEIHLESAPGQGSTFTVRLPLPEAD
jgi:PAS domain S-box-containing protein